MRLVSSRYTCPGGIVGRTEWTALIHDWWRIAVGNSNPELTSLGTEVRLIWAVVDKKSVTFESAEKVDPAICLEAVTLPSSIISVISRQ